MIDGGEVVELLVEVIRNECVNDGSPDGGHEHRSVATLASYFGQDGHIIEPHPGRQSVVYRVPGSEPGAPRLLLIPHLDVVPASGGGWTHDPFDGVRSDGFVWGRGAVDMLNVTAAMAAVFKRYLDGTVPPLPGDLIFAGMADEEAGGVYGAAHMVDAHWDLVACEYALTEVAAPSLAMPGGPVLPVTVAEKGPTWLKMTTRGIPGHASQPYGTRNALTSLADALARLGTSGMPVAISDEWRAFVLALGIGAELESDLLDPDQIDAAIDRIAVDDPAFARWIHACTHLTVTPTKLEAGVKINVVPEDAEGFVDIRCAPGQDEATVDDHLRKLFGPELYEEIDVETIMDAVPTSSATEGPLWDAIGDGVEELTGSRSLAPALVPVGTDARFFRERGAIAYGVGLFDDRSSFAELLSMFHGDDERVSERSVALTTGMLELTLARFGERIASSR